MPKRFRNSITRQKGDHVRLPLSELSWGIARVLYGLTELDRIDLEVYSA
jgi:hypothetical protein